MMSTTDESTDLSDPRIRAAVERIERDYAQPLTVADLARAASMSRYHFSRRFRAATGHSPYRYLIRYRVERGADRIAQGRSVTEAAFEVGFGDLGRFASAFRARFGTLPSRFRRAQEAALQTPEVPPVLQAG